MRNGKSNNFIKALFIIISIVALILLIESATKHYQEYKDKQNGFKQTVCVAVVMNYLTDKPLCAKFKEVE